MKYLPNYSVCFVCGDANEKGLRQRFRLENDYVITNLEARPEYIGHGAVHGGVPTALLDEAMGLSATVKKNTVCVTAELNIRYLKPLIVNKTYIVRGCLVADKKILCETYGEIIDKDLNIFIRATGKYVPLPKDRSHKIHPLVFNYKNIHKKGIE